ncbi:hypothetical protein PYW07_012217 [Mythimna separata]|uniref:Uncharacterized protein n=1 Tax=Mythimna separata TaxID=271217 RepID=A0AAD7YMD0_MYTSE|nr:hypothetical protein PYW07_012217 [Mythimna separata]
MFKSTSLILYAVAVSLSNANEDGSKEFLSMVDECARLNGHTMSELSEVMSNGDVSILKPCFWGCAFTKTGFLNDKGQYDVDSGLIGVKKYMKDPLGLEKLEQMARQCESVNDKVVSDGNAGCERGMLAAKCFLEKDNGQIVPSAL